MLNKLLVIGFIGFSAIYASGISTLFSPEIKLIKSNDYRLENGEVNEEGLFLLGQYFFYSPFFSKNVNTSCATCHLQVTGFAHVDHKLSHGTHGTFGIRNAPGLFNLTNKPFFMRDGRVTDLRSLSEHPITDSLEMDSDFESIIAILKGVYQMDERVMYAFGDTDLTKERILDALFAFVKEIKSTDSKFDKVIVRKEKSEVFTAQEKKGYQLFKKQCMSCHDGIDLTNHTFDYNGLPFDKALNDLGRMRITGQVKDSMKFMVPSLRNVEVTFPYMHDGRFDTLDEVLTHYQGLQSQSNPILNRIAFDDQEKANLKAFLLTLTDTNFLTNTRWGFPPNEFK